MTVHFQIALFTDINLEQSMLKCLEVSQGILEGYLLLLEPFNKS